MAEQEERKRETRVVRCSIPNGIELSFFAPGHDDGTGHKHFVRSGEPVTLAGPSAVEAGVNNPDLAGVENVVDAEWWDRWLAQNPNHPAVASGAIAVVDPEDSEDGRNQPAR